MFQIGQKVKIPSVVSPGPFSDERVVTVETAEGTISGFVRADDFIEVEGGTAYLIGTVKGFDSDTVTVKLRGSFFTTNGLAALPKDRPEAA